MNSSLTSDDAVRIGSRVRVQDAEGEDEFVLVAPDEADVVAHRISIESPLGHALLGRHVGERVRFPAPGGLMGVTVVGVKSPR